MRTQQFTLFSLLTTLVVVILYLGQNLLIPLILSILIWFIIREIRQLMNRIPVVKNYFPNWLENVIAAFFLFTIIGIIITIVSTNIQLLSSKIPFYEKNIETVLQNIESTYHIDVMSRIKTFGGNIELSQGLKIALNSISALFSNTFIILIYLLFILLEESGFPAKFVAIYPNTEKRKSTLEILQKIDYSVGHYLLLKTLVSVLTGTLSFFILLFFGLDAPFFWAFLIFVLNFIPTIGSLIATLFPAIFALLQFGDLSPALWILIVVGAVQMVVGNLIEPKVMGSSLNLSSLVVLLALSFWGAIWGITGMILSVPITVILLILFAEFPSTRNIAILLSEKGKLNT